MYADCGSQFVWVYLNCTRACWICTTAVFYSSIPQPGISKQQSTWRNVRFKGWICFACSRLVSGVTKQEKSSSACFPALLPPYAAFPLRVTFDMRWVTWRRPLSFLILCLALPLTWQSNHDSLVVAACQRLIIMDGPVRPVLRRTGRHVGAELTQICPVLK